VYVEFRVFNLFDLGLKFKKIEKGFNVEVGIVPHSYHCSEIIQWSKTLPQQRLNHNHISRRKHTLLNLYSRKHQTNHQTAWNYHSLPKIKLLQRFLCINKCLIIPLIKYKNVNNKYLHQLQLGILPFRFPQHYSVSQAGSFEELLQPQNCQVCHIKAFYTSKAFDSLKIRGDSERKITKLVFDVYFMYAMSDKRNTPMNYGPQ